MAGHNLKSSSPVLAGWLDGQAHSPEQIHVSLGPNPRTFFAVSDRGFRWGGVNDDFHGHLQGWLTGSGQAGAWRDGYEPDAALFGVNGSYLITCKGGRHLAWNHKLAEKTGYPGLTERLMDRFANTPKEEKWVRPFESLFTTWNLLSALFRKDLLISALRIESKTRCRETH